MLAAGGAGAWGAAACVPLDNLDDYSPTLIEAGGGGSPPEMTPPAGGTAGALPGAPPSNEPSGPGPSGSGGSDTGGAGASGSGSSGSGQSGSGPSGNNSGGASSSGGSNAGSDGPSVPPPSPDAGTTTPDPGQDPTPCADGELEGPDGDCFFLDALAQTFFAARNACRARGNGWDLASVRSPEVSALLGDELTFEGWLVGSDVLSEGTWVWLDDGTPFWQGGATGAPVAGGYANWNATEPNGSNTTNCLRALPRSLGSANPDAPWADLACSDLRGSICVGPQR